MKSFIGEFDSIKTLNGLLDRAQNLGLKDLLAAFVSSDLKNLSENTQIVLVSNGFTGISRTAFWKLASESSNEKLLDQLLKVGNYSIVLWLISNEIISMDMLLKIKSRYKWHTDEDIIVTEALNKKLEEVLAH